MVWLKLTKIFELSKPYLIFKSIFFLTRNIVSPPGKYPWQNSFNPPRHLFFSDHPFSKYGTESCPPAERVADTVVSLKSPPPQKKISKYHLKSCPIGCPSSFLSHTEIEQVCDNLIEHSYNVAVKMSAILPGLQITTSDW